MEVEGWTPFYLLAFSHLEPGCFQVAEDKCQLLVIWKATAIFLPEPSNTWAFEMSWGFSVLYQDANYDWSSHLGDPVFWLLGSLPSTMAQALKLQSHKL